VATLAERTERLHSVPLFSTLGPAALRRVARAATAVDVPAGQVLVEPGTPGSGMFVILDGTVSVDTRRKTLELGPGEFFGELSLLNVDERRTARVRAKTDVRAIALSRRDFTRLVESEPKLALALLQALAQRLTDVLR
jgi:CRP-like cAMP-binding protein